MTELGAPQEPDDDRGMDSDNEKSQDQPNLTRPARKEKGGTPMTMQSLDILGAGQPYKDMNK